MGNFSCFQYTTPKGSFDNDKKKCKLAYQYTYPNYHLKVEYYPKHVNSILDYQFFELFQEDSLIGLIFFSYHEYKTLRN